MTTLLISSFIGGILGALLMDITEAAAARHGITSGVNVALLGRWVMALAHGACCHRDIRESPAHPQEVSVGWLFHLLIGGGGVALLLPLVQQLTPLAWGPTTLLPYVLFGLATSILPWFVLLPAFGWGMLGRHGPEGSNALLASPLSHVPYGIGIWFIVSLGTTL